MSDSTPTRRTVLRTAGLVALAGGGVTGLAACSPDGGTAAPAPSSAPASSPSTAPTPSSSPTPSATASPAKPSPKIKPPSGPSVATSKIPVGGGVILEDADYVVTQPAKGQYKAFSKICTHQGCPVTKVEDGRIKCPCHGSQFSIKNGSVVNPPANKALEESKVTVVGDKVYVDE